VARFVLDAPPCAAQPRAARTTAGAKALMLHYAAVFFVIALVAAVFGFGGLAAGAAGIAKVLFFVALALAVITFLSHGRTTTR
jgi:uncharacterized membrane protein YtjA (UPF0391 family)